MNEVPGSSPVASRCPVTRAAGYYQCAACKLDSLKHVLLLICRVYIGYQAMVAGMAHLQHFDKTTDFFRSLNIPMPALNVVIAGSTEFFGGMLLMFGVAARLVAIPFTFNFVIAIISVHLADYDAKLSTLQKLWVFAGKVVNNQDVVLKDDAFPFFFVGLMVLIFGPGKLSLDYIFLRRLFHRKRDDGYNIT